MISVEAGTNADSLGCCSLFVEEVIVAEYVGNEDDAVVGMIKHSARPFTIWPTCLLSQNVHCAFESSDRDKN